MNIAPGTRLGPYEILAQIGAGGMGEVWKARDTRLERNVAIKVLPTEFAQNAQLRLRFEREAKTISQLDHPNICTLFDVGDDYLVMEFLEGETLADRLARGPLPLADVLKFGTQIAEALDKAHRAGVIHRDLKPGNVMITKSGAKLLDFGLAKGQSSVLGPRSSEDLTQHKPLTQEGTIVGTYQYMAPEQLAGDEADARSDIFSFGALLYEMLTGLRAFEGKTKTSLIAAVIGGEPRPPSQIQPLTPPALEHVITKCLAKERDERWQSAADIASELQWISRSSSAGGVPAAAARTRITRARAISSTLVLSIAALLAAIAALIYLRQRLAVAEQPIRSELILPPGDQFVFGSIVVSPGGTRVAMLAGPRSNRVIAVRDLLSGETRTLAGTDGASYPFWSPDGKTLGFFSQGKLKTIDANGGAVQVICDASQARGGSWSTLGWIVFTPGPQAPIYKVSEGGGTPAALTKPKKGWTHRNPYFLSDGKTFLFIGRDTTSMPVGSLYAGSIDGNLEKLVIENASNAAVANDWLLFSRNRNLVALRFDQTKLTTSGAPIPVAENVAYNNPRDQANFSAAGSLLAYTTAVSSPRQITMFDQSGRESSRIGQPGLYQVLHLSPDQQRLAMRIGDTFNADIWILQLDRGTLSRVTFANSPEVSGIFSPDGRKLAVSLAVAPLRSKVTVQSLDGTTKEDVMSSSPRIVRIYSWSPDGQYLIVGEQYPETGFDIESISLRDHKLTPLLASPFDEVAPSLSPNGKWLAYSSNESGHAEVYVTSFPAVHGKWQVSSGAGAYPRWSPDGKQLYFLSGDNKLNVVDVREGESPEFSASRVVPVVIDPTSITTITGGYELARDGHIITAKRVGDPPPNLVHLVTNWTKLLPR